MIAIPFALNTSCLKALFSRQVCQIYSVLLSYFWNYESVSDSWGRINLCLKRYARWNISPTLRLKFYKEGAIFWMCCSLKWWNENVTQLCRGSHECSSSKHYISVSENIAVSNHQVSSARKRLPLRNVTFRLVQCLISLFWNVEGYLLLGVCKIISQRYFRAVWLKSLERFLQTIFKHGTDCVKPSKPKI